MKALIVDDHALFREGFALLLRAMSFEVQLSQAPDCADAIRKVQDESFDLIFLDWWLEGQSGALALQKLRCVAPSARVVVLSGEKNPRVMDQAIELGACGFIPKDSNKEALVEALRQIIGGLIYLPELSWHAPVKPTQLRECFPELSPRQADVLHLALRGLGNKHIARELNIAPATVATHLIAIYGALGISNRTEAVFIAARRGARID